MTGRWRGDGPSAEQWRRDRRIEDQPRIGSDSVADWRAREAERNARNPPDAVRNEALRERWARDRRATQPNDGVWNERWRERFGTSPPRQGTQPPVRVTREDRDSARRRWDESWRNDRRYDWRNYRNQHRSRFRVGVYLDPFGWSYQRFNAGWRLWPDYYSSNYWINDPGMYRLPPAYPGTRWVRYHDDALLVDMWSGEVIDVIYSFFW